RGYVREGSFTSPCTVDGLSQPMQFQSAIEIPTAKPPSPRACSDANGCHGMCVMRGALATDKARKPSITKQPATIEVRLTFTDPRTLIHAAPQIIVSEMSHSIRGSNPGMK